MADFSNFAAGPQGPAMMVPVTVTFACKHSEVTSVPYTAGTAPVTFVLNDCHCDAPECQKRFVNKLRSELQLAGVNCEFSLRKFQMVEPMLKQELESAGCDSDIVDALLNCSQRSAATAKYLGHRVLLSTLAEYETAAVDQGQINRAHALHLIFSHQAVQEKLIVLQSTVLRLSQKSYPAPALKFPMLEGIQSHEPNWGKQELSTLQSTDSGKAILALPLSNANILVAKSSILSAQNELAELASLQASERASFFSDYPGTEQLHASGAMMSSQDMLSALSTPPTSISDDSSQMDVDAGNSQRSCSSSSADIRSLRPERVLSKGMAAHKCLGLDMDKIHAYSGKSYTALANPWWEQAKKA
jgi:hypothetical protein